MHELNKCKTVGCQRLAAGNMGVCIHCSHDLSMVVGKPKQTNINLESNVFKYPKYFKSIPKGMTEIDVYAVHNLFSIQDPSGAIQHASKKLLLSGVRTGNKSQYQDIKEARDALNRWLELHTPS